MGHVEAAAAAPDRLHVTVACSPCADAVDEVEVQLEAGATVADALRASGVLQRHPGLDVPSMPCGIWGRLCTRDTVLRDHDRVELYRPLQVDPKEARRRRQHSQRARLKAP